MRQKNTGIVGCCWSFLTLDELKIRLDIIIYIDVIKLPKNKNKPIYEEYKVISLCEMGYTYAFIYESRIETNKVAQNISSLNKTESFVLYLVT
ncbi:16412_t:CDS:2 [Gigaspora rosea]|nr:16412_t:CDS:2 [Gigaspora rosea]